MAKSYADLNPRPKLKIQNATLSNDAGQSSPFNKNIYINAHTINKHRYSKNALIGVISHELAHKVSYQNRKFLLKWIFLWNYFISSKKAKHIEKEADKIAIQRGYRTELAAARKAKEKYLSKNKKGLNHFKKIYSSYDDLEENKSQINNKKTKIGNKKTQIGNKKLKSVIKNLNR